jgi:hypothetical protein
LTPDESDPVFAETPDLIMPTTIGRAAVVSHGGIGEEGDCEEESIGEV